MVGPRRYMEFGQACAQRRINGERPCVVYFGASREQSHVHMRPMLEANFFKYWDDLSTSPSKTRPRVETSSGQITGLSLLSCDAAGQPRFPDHILERIPSNDPHHKALVKMKEEFLKEFPQQRKASGVATTASPRVSGDCDFSIDDGKEPLSVERVVDLLCQSPPEAAERTVVQGISGSSSGLPILKDISRTECRMNAFLCIQLCTH